MSDCFVGEIRSFAFGFEPAGWRFCDGTILDIAGHTALFSILQTTYGGDGHTTFALPDLRGTAIAGAGAGADADAGPELSNYWRNELKGAAAVKLSEAQMPSHTHQAYLWKPSPTDTAVPAPAEGSYPTSIFTTTNGTSYTAIPEFKASADTLLAEHAIASTGGGLEHDNIQPNLELNFCICTDGVYPSRP